MDTEIGRDKIAAYLATHYRVGTGEAAFDLRIDTKSDQLGRLYETTGETCGLFITAFNPFGQAQSDEANETAHSRLGQALRALTPHVIEGAGADPTGMWPQEKSFLALGIGKPVACELGVEFSQDAVVWAGHDATPELLLLL